MTGEGPFDGLVTFVFVTDLARSARFYERTLGLRLVRDQGACRIFATGGGGLLGICDHRPVSPGGPILTLLTDDVDGWARRLEAAGVPVDGPRANPRFGIYHCFVRDPDGHLVEIQRFADPLAVRDGEGPQPAST